MTYAAMTGALAAPLDTPAACICDGGGVTLGPTDSATLAAILVDAAADTPEQQIGFRVADGSAETLTYAGLLRQAAAMRRALEASGLGCGDNLVLLLERNQDILRCFWGAALAGARPLIIEVPAASDSSERGWSKVRRMIALLAPRLIVTEPGLVEQVAACAETDRAAVLALDASVAAGVADGAAMVPAAVDLDETAFFCLTSGSTGQPKCVPLSHRNVLVRSLGTNRANGHAADDVYVNWLPFDHIGSIGEHIRCLLARCRMHYLYKEEVLADPLNLLRAIDRWGMTHTWGPNFIYALLRDALRDSDGKEKWDLSSVRFMISGGEPVSAAVMHDFLARAGQHGFPATGCRPSFGMVEVCAGVTYGQPTVADPLPFFCIGNSTEIGAPVGRRNRGEPGAKCFADLGPPIPGCRLRIVDADQRPLPEDTIGYLQLQGPLLLRGYEGTRDGEESSFTADGWLDTGDLGFLSNGHLALTGRAKAMLIINGANYYSHEIEAAVETVPGVETSFTAACGVRVGEQATERLVIFFHPLAADEAALPDLIRRVRQAVVEQVRVNPDWILPLAKAEVPKTPIGKLQRSVLAERFEQGRFAEQVARIERLVSVPKAPPRNALERLLAEIWRDVLGTEPGIHDNFFDLGGSSIKAVTVTNRFQERLGAIFHPVSLFDAPTIAELAAYFEAHYPAVFAAAEAGDGRDQAPLERAQIARMRTYLAHRLCDPAVRIDGDGPRNRRAVFILSPPRSGSTLLRAILAGHPRLFSPPELYLLGDNRLAEQRRRFSGRLAFMREGLVRAVMALRGCEMDAAEALLEQLAADGIGIKALYGLLQDWAGERMLVDKTPPYALNPDILARMEAEFDEPLYIHLMRHPGGMIASFEEARVDLAVDVHGDDGDGRALTPRQKGEAWWLVSHENILAFLADIPAERQRLLRFEDLVTSPEATLASLCGFLGLDVHPDMLEPQREPQRRMTDGPHALSRLAGDPKFHTHTGIAAAAAERWRTRYDRDFLSPESRAIARRYGYGFEHSGALAEFQVTPDPARRHEPFALTDIQEAYWAGRAGGYDLGGYSVHSYTEIDTLDLDLRRLQQAWQRMVDRHDMLRTVILDDGRQRILPGRLRYRIRVADLSSLDPEGIAEELTATRERLSHQVFAGDRWPLYEICVSRLDARRARLHLSFDAILFDARSRYILYAEWRRFYEEPDWQPAAFELSFRDYCLAAERIKDSPLYRRARAWWLERIDDLPEGPQLPLAADPATLRQPRFVQRTHTLPAADWSRLKARAAAERITPSCLLLAVFADVLRLWSRDERFTINLTLYNRQPLHPEVDDLIGDFTSIILQAIEAPGSRGFVARARALQQSLWDNLAHNHFSGVEVLRELSRRAAGRGPAARMPVVFTSVLGDDLVAAGRHTTEWLGQIAYNLAQTPQIWFDHIAFEEGGGLLTRWNIVEGLFPAGLMEAMFDGYVQQLGRLLDDDDAWQHPWAQTAQRLLPPALAEAAREANATDAPLPEQLLHEPFLARAAEQPARPAVIAADRTLSYGELASLALGIGDRLYALGARPDNLVAVVMDKGWQQVAGVLGVLVSGAAYVPLDPGLPAQRLRQLLAAAGAELILTQREWLDGLDWPVDARVLVVDDDDDPMLPAAPAARAIARRQRPEDLAYVIYTSGSTGQPKGVMIEHRGAANTIADINERFGVGPQDRVLALSSLSFDLSVYDLFGPLAVGAALVMPAPAEVRDPARWAALAEAHRVTLWNTVPAFAGLLADYLEGRPDAAADARGLRLFLLSGDWIPLALPARLRACFPAAQVVSLGGATEASIWSILYPVDAVDPAWTSIPYGRPMRNQRFQVLDAALEPCPPWVTGQLYIAGSGLARGYWRDPERTDAAFFTHPRTGERLYRTGDLGRRRPDGIIEFLGREDFQVKVQGFRVELGEIEAALSAHPGVQAAVAVARGEATAEKQLCAYWVAAGNGTPAPGVAELAAYLRERLPCYMVPAVLSRLPTLPLTDNGKVDRRRLPAPDESVGDGAATACAAPSAGPAAGAAPAPDDSVAERLRALLEEVLDGRLGVDDDLFAAGATSIHMMRIVNRVESSFGVRLAIDDCYQAPSARGLAQLVGELADELAENAVGGQPATALPRADQVAWISQRYAFIADAAERAAFTARDPGLRSLDGPAVRLAPAPELDPLFDDIRSVRHFAPEPVALADLGRLLACLCRQERDGRRKYLYGSAGGLYPVQSYLYIKPGRVEGIDGGVYYYDPATHRLVLLSAAELDERIYNPQVNRPIYRRAAFALFLIGDLAAIAPMYQELAVRFMAIEAGLMAQLLNTHAAAARIGLCQIGELAFDRVRHLFQLGPDHMPVHALVGGGLPSEGLVAADAADALWVPSRTGSDAGSGDREIEDL